MSESPGPRLIAAVDQGTTSTRCVLLDRRGKVLTSAQFEHEQILPAEGLVEHDALEIWANVRRAVSASMAEIDAAAEDIAALGLSNQRETAIVWEKATGRPIYNAIVWQDTRTAHIGGEDPARWLKQTGLLANSYPAAPKIAWILDHVDGARERAERGELLAGTMDSWLIWNFTGGAHGDHGRPAAHVTDITNASRTLLMDLETGQWDTQLCEQFRVPMNILPEIRPSIGEIAHVRERGGLSKVPITAVLGDQHAALFGQGCFHPGDAKNTYGTGLFLLMNTGDVPQFSHHGLLTTVAWQIAGERPVYALEGSVAVGGSLIQWLRDQMGIIDTAAHSEVLARQVTDSAGVVIVPAFSGLFAPRWRSDARGVIVGLTRFTDRRHIARAALEATCLQTKEVVDAMVRDSSVELNTLRVDGGMVSNDLLMQLQADILGTSVERPVTIETTALGAGFAAGLGAGLFRDTEEIAGLVDIEASFNAQMPAQKRGHLIEQWNAAVERSYGLA
ncbi:glycerol kinase [Corynebacterium yudongzhengii]|uniref:glycerol kinase n=1 Tax=Corynebacterium yudongzhengii TaxID=2080740 RepID=A0A2U1T887_9CORY|nr:glycerol kinase [Corynebacterium yudongzhengii]PWC02221.1 glycerol kinase [Corynebacterium yudongzhengii]